MPLVVRLVSDTSPKARAAAGDVLRSLLSRLEAQHTDKVVGYCRSWLGQGAEGGEAQAAALRRASAQVLGFLAEVEGARFARRVGELGPALLRVLEQQVGSGGLWFGVWGPVGGRSQWRWMREGG